MASVLGIVRREVVRRGRIRRGRERKRNSRLRRLDVTPASTTGFDELTAPSKVGGPTAPPAYRVRGIRDGEPFDRLTVRLRSPSLSGVEGRALSPSTSLGTVSLPKDRPELVEALLPLVRQIALSFRRRLPFPRCGIEMDDLMGAGSLGLVDALRKFDPRRGVKLESYASHRIRGAILDSLRGLDPASRDLRAKCKKVAAAHQRLEAKLGRPVEGTEMASELGLDLAQWHHWVRGLEPLRVDWLGWQFGSPQGPQLAEGHASAAGKQGLEGSQVSSDSDDPFSQCWRAEQRGIFNRTLAGLPRREQMVLSLYYQRGLTMREIGLKLEVHESRVSQIHAAARARLQKRVSAILRNGQGTRHGESPGNGRPGRAAE